MEEGTEKERREEEEKEGEGEGWGRGVGRENEYVCVEGNIPLRMEERSRFSDPTYMFQKCICGLDIY